MKISDLDGTSGSVFCQGTKGNEKRDSCRRKEGREVVESNLLYKTTDEPMYLRPDFDTEF